MKQIPGRGKFLSIPKPISKKSNNEANKVSTSSENDDKEQKDKYEILKMQFIKLNNQFKLQKIQTMTQINKINYDKNNEINKIQKEKEEMKIENEKKIQELSSKIEQISMHNQLLEKKCNNLNNELQHIQEENKHLKELLNQAKLNKNYENYRQPQENKEKFVFHYKPQENKENGQTSSFNDHQPFNDQQNRNITSILPRCIENKTNDNFPVFNPKDKVYYLFFPEKNQPNYHRSFKKDAIYGVHDAIDIQRFHYYPDSKKIYSFIGFASEEMRNNWLSNFTSQNISYDKLIYAYPYCKSN